MPEQTSTEAARLQALESYSVLDTTPETTFDDLVEIAAAICGVPIALVSFVAGDRQWFKAETGLGVRQTSREVSFCAHALESKQTLIVPDARQDSRFSDNPLVVGDPGIRFYAGAPIIERNGHALGTVCVIDREPRSLTRQQSSALEALARQAVALLEQRSLVAEKAGLVTAAEGALGSMTRSQEHLQLALDSANLGSWYFDSVRNVVGGDEQMQVMFGLETPEAPAAAWIEGIVPEDRARVGAAFAASVEGAPYEIKFRVVVHGEVCWIHSRAKVTPNPDGTVRMVGICEDVTHQERLANDLVKTADRLALAQSVSGATTFDWNIAADTITWGGPTLGRTSTSLASSGEFFATLPDFAKEAAIQVVGRAVETGEEYYHEFQAGWPDGSLHWVSTAGKPLRDENGRVVSVVGVNLDITDRKLSEEALLRSEKLAVVGRLASTISHEINNPLEAVTNLLFIVRNSPDLSQANRDHLTMADRELARVSHVTAQTLRFHRSSLNPTAIKASAIVNEVLDLYQSRLSASSIAVESEIAGDAKFSGFEGDIRQVLNNIVGNAFDAMRKGGTLRIRAGEATDWRTLHKGVAITISDTGPGITAQERRRIFEPFYSTKGISGAGLGLWIAKRIVHKHKGHLSFRTSTGQWHGTLFRLWLPTEVATSAAEGWAL